VLGNPFLIFYFFFNLKTLKVFSFGLHTSLPDFNVVMLPPMVGERSYYQNSLSFSQITIKQPNLVKKKKGGTHSKGGCG